MHFENKINSSIYVYAILTVFSAEQKLCPIHKDQATLVFLITL